MNSTTRKFIEEHIDKIIKEFRFSVRKIKHSEACLCYSEGKCHPSIPDEELNCFLCYCPEYDYSLEEGGCKINNVNGKWYFDKRLPKEKIWDCSDCVYPHREEVVKKYLRRLFGVES